MSLFQIRNRSLDSRWRQIFMLLCLLACVFASCSIHANQSLESLVVTTMDDEHDCCDAQEQCCEQPDGLSNSIAFDLPSVNSGYYFAQLPIISVNASVRRCLLVDKPATGPPIHLRLCRFTI